MYDPRWQASLPGTGCSAQATGASLSGSEPAPLPRPPPSACRVSSLCPTRPRMPSPLPDPPSFPCSTSAPPRLRAARWLRSSRTCPASTWPRSWTRRRGAPAAAVAAVPACCNAPAPSAHSRRCRQLCRSRPVQVDTAWEAWDSLPQLAAHLGAAQEQQLEDGPGRLALPMQFFAEVSTPAPYPALPF